MKGDLGKLSPLKKQIAAAEKKISKLETAIHDLNEKIVRVSQEGGGQEIAQLSQRLHAEQSKANHLYDQLDNLTQEYELKNEGFEKELEELSSA